MRVVEISHSGGADALVMTERPRPVPGVGEVLIQVAASGVNRPDVLQRKGNYPPPPGASDIPGLEVGGRIVEGDLSVANPFGLKIGDEVCALLTGGGYAEFAVAPLVQCLPLPKGVSVRDAAGLPENFFTVWSNVFDRGRLSSGESLLVQGGSSGIGVTAIQIAHALGNTVFATAGSDEKCGSCEALGARCINYKTDDFVARVKEWSGGRGVDVILDMVAGNYVPRELDTLAEDGRLVIISTMGGISAAVDFGKVMRRRLTITGSALRVRSPLFKAAIARQLYDVVWPLIGAGKVRVVVDQVFPAAEAAKAHAAMEAGGHIGKLLLAW